jgi:hypothetical protein
MVPFHVCIRKNTLRTLDFGVLFSGSYVPESKTSIRMAGHQCIRIIGNVDRICGGIENYVGRLSISLFGNVPDFYLTVFRSGNDSLPSHQESDTRDLVGMSN